MADSYIGSVKDMAVDTFTENVNSETIHNAGNTLKEDTLGTASNILSGAANKAGSAANAVANYFITLAADGRELINTVTNTADTISQNLTNKNDTVKSSAKASAPKETRYYIPSLGAMVTSDYANNGKERPLPVSPILNTYSPRLFGAPPQLTSLCDMRYLSHNDDDSRIGPVGDFYLTKILQDAQVANFVVGKALFTGGMASSFGIISMVLKYALAIKRYDIFGSSDGVEGTGRSVKDYSNILDTAEMEEKYKNALALDDGSINITVDTDILGTDEDEVAILDINSIPEAAQLIQDLGSVTGGNETRTSTDKDGAVTVIAGVTASLLTSLSVQQPFYTFEADWHSYIECVKMMINTAVIQLGLQEACIRIGDDFIPLSMSYNNSGSNEPWSLYSSWITQSNKILSSGSITGIDTLTGDSSQYVSFMVDPAGSTESYTNTVGDSQIYAQVINQGSEVGSEIAFLTNSSKNSVDDAIINIAGSAIGAAEKVLTAMTAGVGRFTAAVAGSFARSFVGNHTIYPQIFKEHSSTQTREITIHLNASGGDPYSYLMDILVPYFFILGMALPQLSKNNAAAYSFPPLVQCNIPGVWGTRLGMVTSVSVNKNSSGKDLSINGYPLSIDVTMTVTDLQHVLLTSPQDRASTFLNNHTMFDYIAVCAGVDKYRPNGAMRLVSRLALAANDVSNVQNIIGNAILTDFTSFVNRTSGIYQL